MDLSEKKSKRHPKIWLFILSFFPKIKYFRNVPGGIHGNRFLLITTMAVSIFQYPWTIPRFGNRLQAIYANIHGTSGGILVKSRLSLGSPADSGGRRDPDAGPTGLTDGPRGQRAPARLR